MCTTEILTTFNATAPLDEYSSLVSGERVLGLNFPFSR